MDSMEVNKVIAAVLVAGIAYQGLGVLSGVLSHPRNLEKPAIAIAMPQGAGGEQAAPQKDPPVAALLATASVQAGQEDTHEAGCIACHSFTKGGKAGVGPNLWGVVGAPHGHMEGYEYSDALKAHKGPWTYAELYEWLKKPSAYAPGTKMTFAGIDDPKERADIIDYLHTLSDNPEPLPNPPPVEKAAVQTPAAQTASNGQPSIDTLLASADPKEGEQITHHVGCIACHTFNQGGAAGIGPNLYNVVGAPHAHMEGYEYSDALKAKKGPWTYAELNEWLTKPSAYAPGTKMTFAGIEDPNDRANVIAYLRTLSPNPEPLPKAGK